MTVPGRLSICYVVPGHDLMSTVGPSRNVLNLARALARSAEVTVAFRRMAEPQPPAGIRVLEIQPQAHAATLDDAATRGIGYGAFWRYLNDLRRFAREKLADFDVVLEKSWLLSGYVSSLCRRRGQLAVPIENIVADPRYAARRQWAKHLRMSVGRWLAGRALREAPLVIAETEFLKREMTRYWRLAPERIAVVDLGVDRNLFRPLDQAPARARLGIAPSKTVLTYVGILDYTHDLGPAVAALLARRNPTLELHIVGNGERAAEYTAAADNGAGLVLHGRVPHDEVPWHIAAADLCLAPYNPAAFSSGELGYSTMKIPEYLSVGRPVVSVPSGRIRTLIDHGRTGFLFDNETARWEAFLSELPARARLAEMGEAAAATPLPSWEDTAQAYLDLCTDLLSSRHATAR